MEANSLQYTIAYFTKVLLSNEAKSYLTKEEQQELYSGNVSAERICEIADRIMGLLREELPQEKLKIALHHKKAIHIPLLM